MPDIYSAITADHDQHRKWLETIANTQGDSPERGMAWNAFCRDIKSHAAAKEEPFTPS